MLKMSVEVDFAKLELLSNVRKLACVAVANIMMEEFETMLYMAPQYSGNYVANMRLGSGVARGRSGGELIFPIPNNSSEALRHGDMEAINASLRTLGNFTKNATAHITKKVGWISGLTVYNNLEYSDTVEHLDRLRAENAGGEHAVEQMIERLANRSEVFKW